jgi:hypothetical protein
LIRPPPLLGGVAYLVEDIEDLKADLDGGFARLRAAEAA